MPIQGNFLTLWVVSTLTSPHLSSIQCRIKSYRSVKGELCSIVAHAERMIATQEDVGADTISHLFKTLNKRMEREQDNGMCRSGDVKFWEIQPLGLWKRWHMMQDACVHYSVTCLLRGKPSQVFPLKYNWSFQIRESNLRFKTKITLTVNHKESCALIRIGSIFTDKTPTLFRGWNS